MTRGRGGSGAEVSEFPCNICQKKRKKTEPKACVSKLPLGKMPLIGTPFSRVAIDVIGAIHPPYCC